MIYVSSEGSGQSEHMYRLALDFSARQCDKYQNLLIIDKPKCNANTLHLNLRITATLKMTENWFSRPNIA